MGDRRGADWVLVERPNGKRPLRRWEDNIKMNLQEVEWGDMEWVTVARNRDRCWAVVNAVMNLLTT
jgi:hypothetical protein